MDGHEIKVVKSKETRVWSPFNDCAFQVRNYQKPILDSLLVAMYNKDDDDFLKRFILNVQHRRGGKDVLGQRFAARFMDYHPGSNCYTITDTRVHCHDIFWDKMNPLTAKFKKKDINYSNRMMDENYPPALRMEGDEGMRNSALRINWHNGSFMQYLGGGEDIDRIRGLPGDLFIITEFADCAADLISIIHPMVLQSNGIMYVNGTPKGHDHLYELYHDTESEDFWEKFYLPASKTVPESFSHKKYEQAKKFYMGSEHKMRVFKREYECAWEAPVLGSVWGEELERAEADGRVGNNHYDPNYPVDTNHDIGYTDPWVVWFTQNIEGKLVFIDHYAQKKQGVGEIVSMLNKKPYARNYGRHFLPHDSKSGHHSQESSEDKTDIKLGKRVETGRVEVLEVHPTNHRTVDESLRTIQEHFDVIYFDKNNDDVMKGLQMLKNYKFEYTIDELGVEKIQKSPVHNEASHHADAFRYALRGFKKNKATDVQKEAWDEPIEIDPFDEMPAGF